MEFNENFEKLRADVERGYVSVCDLTAEQSKILMEYYRKEVQENQKDIENIRAKISDMKRKIDNLV